MATIREIAKACGVSTATVSKALNGYPDVGEETRNLVQKTAKEFGYFPNSAARALKTNHTSSLGVLFIDNMGSGLGHEHFSSIIESFKAQAERMGYDITFISRNLGGKPMSFLEHCRYRRCDGVVIACINFNDPEVQQLVYSEIPVITIDHLFNNCTAIMSDNVDGMQQLVRYICSRGHRRIAYVHGEDTAVSQKRLAGFFKTCEEFGVTPIPEYIKSALYHDPKSSALATRELLSLPILPTCILYPDDFSFIGGMNEVERHGLKIPTDISVAGFDGILLSQVLRPRLTTLWQNTQEMGIVAAKKLVQAIREPKTTFAEQIIVPGKLLKGGTVAAL